MALEGIFSDTYLSFGTPLFCLWAFTLKEVNFTLKEVDCSLKELDCSLKEVYFSFFIFIFSYCKSNVVKYLNLM